MICRRVRSSLVKRIEFKISIPKWVVDVQLLKILAERLRCGIPWRGRCTLPPRGCARLVKMRTGFRRLLPFLIAQYYGDCGRRNQRRTICQCWKVNVVLGRRIIFTGNGLVRTLYSPYAVAQTQCNPVLYRR